MHDAPTPSLAQQLTILEADSRATADDFAVLATRAIKRSEPLIAFDITSEALRRFPDDTRLLQKRVEALVRAGSIEPARQILESLRARSTIDDEETLGFFGRVDKEVWWLHRDDPSSVRYLMLALDGYQHAYARTGGYWSGINAATLASCAGDQSGASNLAAKISAQCEDLLTRASPGRERYFLLATLGESELVRGDHARAADWYRQATSAAGRNFGDIASTRRNARILLTTRCQDASVVNTWLPIPRVIVFSGHMIDRASRRTPRFPPSAVEGVVKRFTQWLANDVSYAFASAASGADLLFLRSVLQAGGDVHIVLPFNREAFFATSVSQAGEPWASWYHELLDPASPFADRIRLTELSHLPGMNPQNDYEYANQVLYGLARVRSLELAAELDALAVWHPGNNEGVGGTGSAVAFWQQRGLAPNVIDPLEGHLTEDPATAAPADGRSNPAQINTPIAAMLFADAKGFSKLPDDQMLPFVEQYLGLLKQVIDDHGVEPMLLNTWGDGLYMVFKSVRDAGTFALRLCDALDTAKEAGRLKLDLRLRIGLHAGPVYPCHNPATGRPDVVGTHVTRTARLEPVTPPGQVYASEAFAALAYAEHVQEFRCDYVGPTSLDKSAGTVRAYHVRRWRNVK
ncbi:MAG TPA: adenylate/guanylate cyclase domain-containing protein [Tepidisphaeraceae bacterium]|nr:adenylate/guanylate cyclase domain-containing protein [Tepidisphaeraceae bacterium]